MKWLSSVVGATLACIAMASAAAAASTPAVSDIYVDRAPTWGFVSFECPSFVDAVEYSGYVLVRQQVVSDAAGGTRTTLYAESLQLSGTGLVTGDEPNRGRDPRQCSAVGRRRGSVHRHCA